MIRKNSVWWLAALLIILASILWLDLRTYHGNPSALFHIDENVALRFPMPQNTVILKVPGYDGMEYYKIARAMPLLFQPSHWPQLQFFSPGYAFQRITLPALGFVLAFGQAPLLPFSFLFIQIAALLGVFFLVLKRFQKPLFAFALALCPAAMVGLHFSLAEPLSLLLITAFLYRFEPKEKIRPIDILLLSAIVLSREINIFFAVATFGYVVYKKNWRSALLLLIPLAVFALWHGYIYTIFHQIPFLMSTDKRALPLSAIFDILIGKNPYTLLTLTSIALFLGFVLPGTIFTVQEILSTRRIRYIPCMAFCFFLIMLSMPDYIWGSITSIGRVITPTYPLFVFMIASRTTLPNQLAAVSLLALGVSTAIGLALSTHPFFLA